MMPAARRVQLYFLVQFMSVGMINAYAGIWFDSIGLSAFQIGVIGAGPIVLLLAITLFVGRLADRARDWRQVIVWGATLSGAIPLALFVADGFVSVLIIWTCLATAQRVVLPVADGAAMRMSRRGGADFGSLRALSTIGYLLVILGAGYLLRDHGVALFLPVFVALGLLRSGASWLLPNMRAVPPQPDAQPARFSAVLKPWFVLPLIGWALIDTNHIIINTFQGLLWAKQGIPTEVVGLLITLGALAETAMFFAFRHVAHRFSPITLLFMAAVASVIRWLGMALAPGIFVLIGLQLLHALTYAMGFLAVTHFIADNTSEDNAAEAQSFLLVLELVVSVGALVLFGWLAGLWGAKAYLASALIAAFGGLCVLSAARRQVTL